MTRIVALRVDERSQWEVLAGDIASAVRSSGQRFARVDAYRAAERVAEYTRSWEVPFDSADENDDEPDESTSTRDGGVSSAHAGLLRQAHAHVDRYMQLFQGLVSETLQHHRETTQSLRSELMLMRTENAELQKLVSTREDERAERDIRVNREKAIADGLSTLISAISVRLGAKRDITSAELVKLLDSLTAEKQDAIVAMLSDEQRMLLASIFKSVGKP